MATRKSVLIAFAVLALALSASASVTYTVTGATGTYSDATTGISGNITGVFPPNDPKNDNKLYIGNSSHVDAFGIMLNVGGVAVTLYYDNGYFTYDNGVSNTAGVLFVKADPNQANTFDFWNLVRSPKDAILNGKFTVSDAPEPSALVLLGTGVLGFWTQRKRWA